jgi:hypothetical protein
MRYSYLHCALDAPIMPSPVRGCVTPHVSTSGLPSGLQLHR